MDSGTIIVLLLPYDYRSSYEDPLAFVLRALGPVAKQNGEKGPWEYPLTPYSQYIIEATYLKSILWI